MPAALLQRLSPARRPVLVVLLAGVLLPALLCVGVATTVLWSSHVQHVERAELNSQNLAAAIERTATSDIEKVDAVLMAIVAELEAQLALGRLDSRLAQRQIETQAAIRPELEGIRVTDATGLAILGQALQGRAPISFADRDWFRVQRDRADAGLHMSQPLASRITGETIISFSRRYRHADGTFAGAVTAAVPLTYFKKTIAAVDVGPHGIVAMRGNDLGLIARHPPTPNVSAGTVGNRAVSREMRELVSAGLPHATYYAKVTADGTERITTFRKLTVVPMMVIVGLATDDYLQAWRAEVRNVLAFCLGVIALFVAGSLVLMRAMAQNRASRQRIDLLAKVYEHSGEAVTVMDRDNRIVEVNPAFVQRTGYRPAEVIGRPGKMMLSASTTEEQYADIAASLRRDGRWRGELTERTKDGREVPMWMVFSAVRDASGRVAFVISNSIDLSELKRAEAQIRHLAHHDTLTRLPNRVLLQARLEQAMVTARREGTELAMLFIDLDRFKTINDTLGHPVGDALLIEVGQRLRAIVRDSDIVARLGGDEFVLVLTGLGTQAAHAANTVAAKLLDELGRPYSVGRHELHTTPSIGIGIFPLDGVDGDTLMKCADTAMYCAKAAGRNTFQFFTPEMKQASAERLAIESGLRTAVGRHELLLHFQPQVDFAEGRVVGLEALVRWHHPELGLIPPNKFIPVAEESGQIESIGLWVLEQALAQVAQWRAHIDPRLRVAVNVSAQQLRGDVLANQVAAALARNALPGDALELEVTESTAMRDPARTATQLRELRALGVGLAIDDFGTGHSSLTLLKQLPLSSLKLDRSFVMDIEHDANDAAICRATIQLAHSMGLAVIAEGVETAAQMQFLRALQCDAAQGYLIARPAAAVHAEAFLKRAQAAERATDATPVPAGRSPMRADALALHAPSGVEG